MPFTFQSLGGANEVGASCYPYTLERLSGSSKTALVEQALARHCATSADGSAKSTWRNASRNTPPTPPLRREHPTNPTLPKSC